ncbi:MAG: hypothetical protein U0575_04525 [Phycisphaerales bacterium]
MHVLTKIFIVLVALLAVMLTPLVVVYANNEGTFRTKFLEEQARSKSASAAKVAAEQALQLTETRAMDERRQLESDLAGLRKDVEKKDVDVRRLDAEIANAKSSAATMTAQLATLAASLKADSQLKEVLVGELRSERDKALAAEKRFIEMDEKLRKTENDLQTLEAARRDLQEQLKQVVDEKDRALGDVNRYMAIYGKLDNAKRAVGGVVPDRNVTTTILNVRRSSDGVLAEIDAGSRDGVREGWVMVIADGGTFIGNLRIIKVDVNRSTGVVELEDPSARGEVRAGQRVIAKAGG